MNKTAKKSGSILLWILLMVFSFSSMAQRYMEKLDHGLVAVNTSEGVFISWRVLASEWKDVAYNIYRDGALVNGSPINGASNLLDANGTSNSSYTVKTIFKGIEQETAETAIVWDNNYIDIPVRDINGGYNTHELNDASVGDLDGDGQYEIVVKRLAIGGVESGDYHFLEAYELDGTFLWAVNMGPNIYNDVEFNFLVWDLDCDGKAEVTLRTSDGFVDGEGNDIGDADNDGIIDYRYSISWAGYRMEGPDYLSVLEGETGRELDRVTYIPRGDLADWGKEDDGGHRSTKCMFTVAYQDGKKPSVVFGRGIYERTVLESWNFDGSSLSRNWHFDSNSNPDYASQGYHNLTQGDVDNDGRDEVVYGSMVMDDNGQGLYSTKLGHGDAQHLSDINPDRYGLEYFGCLENSTGGDYRDARTGEILHYTSIGRDMGRAGCADITTDYPGMEMWGPSGFPFLSSTGDVITDLTPPSSMNFFIFWDGDLSREILDHAWYSDHGVGTITKYNNGANTQLLYASGTLSNNWTKGTPSLSADVLGDWREEVIWRTDDNSALRLYTTTNLTTHKIYTLMHDPQYRAAIGWQPNSYNQPPHPGFFIGTDMDSVPPAPILMPDQKVWTSGKWDIETASWSENETTTNFENGDKVLFDISGDNSSDIVLEGSLTPEDVRVISPIDYVFAGSGSIEGETDLTKAGIGNLTLDNTNNYTGITRVWDGQLTNNGAITNSKVLVKRFAHAAGNGTFGKGIVLEKYANLIVSEAQSSADTLFVSGSLTADANSNIDMDLSDDIEASSKINDIIIITGNLVIDGSTSITINRLDDKLAAGEYILMTVSDSLIGSIDDIEIKGISGVPFELKFEEHKLKLAVSATRQPSTVVWNGAIDNKWDLFDRLNWLSDETADYFLGEDSVVFDNSGLLTTVEILDEYAISNFLFNADKDYDIRGAGSFSGNADLIKKGAGILTIRTKNSYTGATIIEEGLIRVPELGNAGYNSGIGAATAEASKIFINGGELELYSIANMTTDRSFTFGENDGTISIANVYANLSITGNLRGSGRLIKNGKGTLSLKNSNSHKGTVINDGTIQLTDDPANISGLGDTVTINGGTLAMNDNSYSYTDGCRWHIVVREGKTGTLKLDSRSSLTGKLFGAGKLILYSPWIRNDLNGDWSAFSGTIEITTDNDGGDWRINNNYGYENATVILNNNIYAYNLKGTTKIGALYGKSVSTLASGTWSIGYNNENATYSGLITGTATINKYGTGNWTLTNANDYSGTTNIYDGTLTVNNSSGSATGSGGVFVRSGAMLEGNGSIEGTVGVYSNSMCNMGANSKLNGPVNVQGSFIGSGYVNNKLTILKGGVRKGDNVLNGEVLVRNGGTLSGEGYIKGILSLNEDAIIAPGTDGVGKLTCETDVTFADNGVLEIEINKAAVEHDVLSSSSGITLNGILKISELSSTSFEEGDKFKILDAESIAGNFVAIEPVTPGDGLAWDLSDISNGYIGVKTSVTSANTVQTAGFLVYPNPGSGIFYLKVDAFADVKSIVVTNSAGRAVYSKGSVSSELTELNLQNLPVGVYLLKIKFPDKELAEKLILK